jgi:hypothetical protein
VQQWLWSDDYSLGPLVTITSNRLQNVATQAAQWGANQELEATLGLMETLNIRGVDYIRNVRRPKPPAPSLKQQALEQLREVNAMLQFQTTGGETSAIRRALEALPND